MPWETLATVMGPIPRHLERAEAVARFFLTTGHDFLGVYLHLLGVAANEAMPEWMVTTCSNALDSLNTRLMTSSIGTQRLDVKWSRSQAQALDKYTNKCNCRMFQSKLFISGMANELDEEVKSLTTPDELPIISELAGNNLFRPDLMSLIPQCRFFSVPVVPLSLRFPHLQLKQVSCRLHLP
ncbi:hypothetical protein TNCV_1218021 [Trichonephila clavipes]|nr:hypothetical protein TNCV_1218021 [Trichonephila clavipes]